MDHPLVVRPDQPPRRKQPGREPISGNCVILKPNDTVSFILNYTGSPDGVNKQTVLICFLRPFNFPGSEMDALSMTAAPPRKAPNQLSAARERELLNAAREAFIEEGFDGATIDQIASRARVSKTTIYRRYRNKEALFEAIINDEADQVAAELQDYELDPTDPVRSLRNAASAIYAASGSDRNVELRRLMVAQARRYPEICREARNKLLTASSGRLPAFFETLIARGRMRPVNPALAANTFALVVSGGLRPLFSVTEPDEVLGERFEMEIALFVEGWGIDS